VGHRILFEHLHHVRLLLGKGELMARYLFGGGGDGDIVKPTGLPYTNASANVYNARTGGTAITDLQDIAGNAVASVVADANGQILFYGPDNFIGTLWLDFGTGIRWALSPKAVDLAATRAVAVQRTADAAALSYTQKARLPYSPNDPLEQTLTAALDPMVIPRFGSDAARDAAFPSPQEGDRCYRTDLSRDQVYDSISHSWVGLVAVAPWASGGFGITPTSGVFFIGSGSSGLRWRVTGKSISFYLWVNFASDTVPGSGTWTISLPFSVSSSSILNFPMFGQAFSGPNRVPITGLFETANTMSLWSVTSTTNTTLSRVGGSPPPGGTAWNSGSFFRIGGTVEAA
jgi:hypothetical protein